MQFFFTRLKLNDTGRYTEEFPYLSICGRERNFIRCDDLPVVFTNVLTDSTGKEVFSYGHAGDLLTYPFEPNKIYMSPTGRIYHPAFAKVGSIGLIQSKRAIEFSKFIEFRNGENTPPTHFTWNNKEYTLDSSWVMDTIIRTRHEEIENC